MANIGSFLKHLKYTSEKTTNELLFLKNFFSLYGFDPNQLINSSVFMSLVNFIHQNSIIYNKKEAVFEQLKLQLMQFYKKHPLDISLADIKKSLDRQVIDIEDPIELMTVVSKHIKKSKANDGKKVKLKSLASKQVMALILDSQSRLEVRIYSSRAKIIKGSISSLNPISHLFYNSFMELQPGPFQRLYVNETYFAFKIFETKVVGHAIKFKNFGIKDKISQLLNSNCSLFYPLKSIEKHYIDLSSDPFYSDLCTNIDKAIDSLKLKQPEAIVFSKKAIKQAYLALKYVFDDDNYLKYKLLELERTIQAEVQWVSQNQIQPLS